MYFLVQSENSIIINNIYVTIIFIESPQLVIMGTGISGDRPQQIVYGSKYGRLYTCLPAYLTDHPPSQIC